MPIGQNIVEEVRIELRFLGVSSVPRSTPRLRQLHTKDDPRDEASGCGWNVVGIDVPLDLGNFPFENVDKVGDRRPA